LSRDVVADLIEVRINIAELFADSLDEGSDIGAVSVDPRAGRESLAMNQIVKLAIGSVLKREFRRKS
jgi:hypothetical protein